MSTHKMKAENQQKATDQQPVKVTVAGHVLRVDVRSKIAQVCSIVEVRAIDLECVKVCPVVP
jgi:hypothetical protein